MTRYISAFAALMLSTSPVMAQVPTVATDIAPIHSLVAQVMGDLGEPTLLMDQSASPHSYAMRPSEARNLQQAGVVFWSGNALTPWLGGAIDTLAPNAVSVPLIEEEASIKLEFRQGATFEAHDHADHADHDGHESHDDHDHDDHAADEDHDDHDHDDHATDQDHDDHDHDDHAADQDHDDHDHEDHAADEDHDDHDHDDHAADEGHEGHDHTGLDPHAWLDPQNAIAWLDVIAKTLSDLDAENAQTYAANAAEGAVQLTALTERLQEQLADEHDLKFVVFHDAYHYFESRFDLNAAGAISLSDGAAPSPARISELQHMIKDEGVDCVFAEPQFNAGLVKTILEGTSAHSGVIDPLGRDIDLGSDFYGKLIQGVADSFDACR
ncbi:MULTISPECIES: zinc ABC transporter substrate-binding protein [Pacificibacter]|uniref:zinc ABC transporter substrate-binding protein n=1 Tax=Pacificibacter TaxID=1042323 RepID=UPI001C0912A4|nr:MULTISPECIES: zinc ABC transporter substrate-binding protein [Pacificibacter]MBU2934718.1 zinc ABC transporter substrate-binding protein [Pacificibacter marinus]MDO6616840.1 zinc ABC transporter substrate-binding protein [Pacificibacter sp. 1_MG-2023]